MKFDGLLKQHNADTKLMKFVDDAEQDELAEFIDYVEPNVRVTC